MRPIFFSFKSINMTWFMALSLLAVIVSYSLLKILAKNNKASEEDKENLENTFFLVLVSGFIGARLVYAIFHINTFIASPTALIKLSHYNLSLVGGVLAGLVALFISCKRYKMDFLSVLDKFSILFYISMAIGVWNFLFDRFLLKSSGLGNINIKVTILSIIFALAALVQIAFGEKFEKRYISIILLASTLIIYYLISLGLIF